MRAPRLRHVAAQLAQQRRAARAERERRTHNPWTLGVLPGSARTEAPSEQPLDGQTCPPDGQTSPPDSQATPPAPHPPAADPAGQDDAPATDPRSPFGTPGPPISQSHPFVIGFFGATGVLAAWFLLGLLGRLSSVLTLVVIALFLALALDPLVRALHGRGMPRAAAVGLVFLAVVGVFVGFGFAVVPPLVNEAADLTGQLLEGIESFQENPTVQRLDEQFGLFATITDQITTRLRSGETVLQLFGGVLGAGQAVISGAFSTFTVLVLTLYFTASLNTLREAVYQLVPASRRARVRLLGDEIIRRMGGYIAGQIAVASINATLTYVLLLILSLPFALVLAITVGVLGLIPLVGATIGALVVSVVALFVSWQYAVVVVIYYLVYQQVENYLIAPRIMSRTVKLPGFLVVIAALAGGTLLGVLGALIAIPIAAGILLVIQEVLIPRQQRT